MDLYILLSVIASILFIIYYIWNIKYTHKLKNIIDIQQQLINVEKTIIKTYEENSKDQDGNS
jgi:hypothetical protein